MTQDLPEMQQRIVDTLAANPNGLDRVTLAKIVRTSKGSLSKTICKMRARGVSIYSPRKNNPNAKRKGVPQIYRLAK